MGGWVSSFSVHDSASSPCEHGNGTSRPIKAGEFLAQAGSYQLLKKDSLLELIMKESHKKEWMFT
jgi:hypothetical protein